MEDRAELRVDPQDETVKKLAELEEHYEVTTHRKNSLNSLKYFLQTTQTCLCHGHNLVPTGAEQNGGGAERAGGCIQKGK